MKERIAVFLFSLIMVVGSLATAAWMIATGQVVNMDGIFLFLVLLLLALVFFLCIASLLKGAKESAAQAATAKPAPAARAAAAPVPAATAPAHSEPAATH